MKKLDAFSMDIFEGGQMPELPEFTGESRMDMLDYMVLVTARCMSCSVAFKGGYMLNKLLGNASRLTSDIDFSIAQRGDYASVKEWLGKIADEFVKVGLIHSYKIKEDIQERQSGGIDMYDELGQKVLGVDVGLHNIGYGVRHYDLGFVDIDGFSTERMLADKLIAITTRKRFRRTKDLYDVYAITNFFDVDYKVLSDFIERRGGAEWGNIPFNDDVIVQYLHAWQKLDLMTSISQEVLEKPEFVEALNRFYALALPLKDGDTDYRWEHEHGRRIHL